MTDNDDSLSDFGNDTATFDFDEPFPGHTARDITNDIRVGQGSAASNSTRVLMERGYSREDAEDATRAFASMSQIQDPEQEGGQNIVAEKDPDSVMDFPDFPPRNSGDRGR